MANVCFPSFQLAASGNRTQQFSGPANQSIVTSSPRSPNTRRSLVHQDADEDEATTLLPLLRLHRYSPVLGDVVVDERRHVLRRCCDGSERT